MDMPYLKTKLIERARYLISGEDQSRLIPSGVEACTVIYERGKKNRKPVSITFEPSFEPQRKDESEEASIERYEKDKRRVNSPRTPEEIVRIVNRLESSLTE